MFMAHSIATPLDTCVLHNNILVLVDCCQPYNTASAEAAIGLLGLDDDDIRGERTAVMIKMLKYQIKGVVEDYVTQGIINR